MQKSLLIILGTILLCTQIAAASNDKIFTTYPTYTKNQNKWIVRSTNPGREIQDYITVENLSNNSITINLDIEELGGTKEKPKILNNQKFEDIGNWTTLEKNQLTLDANQKEKIKFKILPPENAELKEYQEVILASHITQQESDLNVATRIGNRIYLTLNNDKELQTNTQNLEITPLQLALIIFSSLGIIGAIFIPKKQK